MRAPLILLAAVVVAFGVFSFPSVWIQLLYCCEIDSFIEICVLTTGIYHNSVCKWHWKTAPIKKKIGGN